jgi:hypothetical protein
VESRLNELRVGTTDREINDLLARADPNGSPPDSGLTALVGDRGSPPTRHFNQTEDFFLSLDRPFTVYPVPIHHDVENPTPGDAYLASLRRLLSEAVPLAPQAFSGLTYFFDPADILHPAFFRIYRVEDAQYLYLLKMDLTFRAQDAEITRRGTNDITAEYRTRHLYLESLFIPLQRVQSQAGRITSFVVKQTISQTWIGETGRGYFVQGIWIDLDLTRFFSRLFIPQGRRLYPFYPFVCKYKTVCQTVVDHESDTRRLRLPYLHGTLKFLSPRIPEIQEALRGTQFSENLEPFRRIKAQVPASLSSVWGTYNVEMYLNSQDMKEFRIEPCVA